MLENDYVLILHAILMNSITKNKFRIISFDIRKIADYLLSRQHPIGEVELLKYLMGVKMLSECGEELYSLHFSLFHALYRLRREPICASHYLHLDIMRLRMVAIPRSSRCVYYFSEEGRFCEIAVRNGLFCAYHQFHAQLLGNSMTFNPMEDFYLNPDNIRFGESELLAKLQRGVILYSIRRGQVDEALKFFGLHNPSRKALQKSYYEFAKRYHPDFIRGDDSMMKKVNYYYQVLREIFLI